MKMIRMAAAALTASLTFATDAVAQDRDPGEGVMIELNAVKSGEGAAR